jgi:hypothetical protein
MVKIKGSLKLKKQIADIISVIVLEFKEKFKNLDLSDIKNDSLSILWIMEQIEEKSNDRTLISSSNSKKIDKNIIVLQIVKILFPDIKDDEIKTINGIIELVIGSKYIKKSWAKTLGLLYLKKKVLG